MKTAYPDKNRTIRTVEDGLYAAGAAAAAIAASLAALFCLLPELFMRCRMPPCLFHLATGYYCPGCGGTRAVKALLDGQVLLAFYYHPVVPYSAALYLYFMATQTIERLSRRRFPIGMRFHSWQLWTAAAAAVLNFILKNALHYFYGFLL